MLDHPNLVKVYALETESGWFSGPKRAKLLIEYVPGRPMDGLPLLRMAKLIRVFERIADGLMHMHKRGVYHADLKPNNLIYDRGTRVKVIDYGLAWVKGEAKNRVQGTPEYMAPETVSHKLVNERTDIYNFGATMYRLCTLQLPPCWVTADGGLPLSGKVFKEQIRPVNEANPLVPRGLAELIHQCLAPKATGRPERMSQVQGALDQLADEAAAKLNDPAALEE
jgi:serine/threonine protein kinase